MPWLGFLLAVCFLFLGVGVIAHRPLLTRHVHRPDVVVATVLAVCVIMIPTSLSVALLAPADGILIQLEAGAAVLALAGVVGLVLSRRRSPMAASATRRVLVVGAHPDDLELACGGSLARFTDEGHEVRAIIMSAGSQGGHAESRVREAEKGAETLDLAGLAVHSFTDTMMATEIDTMVKAIEAAVALFQPDVILTHSVHDQHQDHHAVHLATLRAGRRCPTILCFESPSVTSEFNPRYFVDVSDYMDVKIAAVQAHAGQSGKAYMSEERLRGMAVFRGSQAKTDHAEAFEVVRALSSQVGTL